MKKLLALMLAMMIVLATLTVPALAENAPKTGKVKTVVTLSHSGTVTLNVGDVLQLGATVTPEAPVAWSSGKAKVATVDASGLVHAVAEGTATITAKAGGKSAKVKIKVVDPWKPTGVSIANGKAVTVGVGEAVQLSAVLAPATARATLAWSSKKPGIASVDGNGVVYGVSKGKTKVTVKAGKKKATVTVNVINPNEPTGVVLSHSGTVQLCENEQLQLYASLQPANAIGTVAWGSSKASVATVDGNGVVTAHKKGTATITAKVGKKKANVKVKVVGAEQHEHNWEAVTEQRYVYTRPEWGETVVDKAAWDETVVDAAWDETVVVKEAWTETVVDKEEWDEYRPFIQCYDCKKRWWFDEYDENGVDKSLENYAKTVATVDDEAEKHIIANNQYYREHGEWPPLSQDTCEHGSWWQTWEFVERHPAETHTVDHPAETKVVHHDAVTHVVHHDAVTHVVHHDAEGHFETVTVGHRCTTCGIYEAW